MNRLVAQTGESASFWMLQGEVRICIYRVNSPRMARSHVEEGETSPLDRGSAGHVICHYAGLASPNRVEIHSALARDGAIASLGERDPDVGSVAAPIFGAGGQCIGAITLAGILGRFAAHVPAYLVLVSDAAAAISADLGARQTQDVE